MHICNMVKVISIADDAYQELKELKEENESFSDVVRRITQKERSKSFLDLAGSWKADKDIENIFKKVLDDRKGVKFRV